MRKLLIIIPYLAVVFAPACAIHQVDVQQGNVVTPQMAEQLSIGMTKRQVRFLLGTPLLMDPFTPDRWDYIYMLNPGKPRAKDIEKRITVYFEDDRIVRIETNFPDQDGKG